MGEFFIQPTGKIDRRFPRNSGKTKEDVYLRENLISRNGYLTSVKGTNRITNSALTGQVRWLGRYHSIEIGSESPKTFGYTADGKLHYINESAQTTTQLLDSLNVNGYPKHWLFKKSDQTIMYLVDGKSLYKFDGNNDNKFQKVPLSSDLEPIDIIEHKDRSFLLTSSYLIVSANLSFEDFSNATDSIQIIVGSGKGKNLALGKIKDKLYIFNTEGIFELSGDNISALAVTFEIIMADNRKCMAGRTVVSCENEILFMADDLEIWSFNGVTSQLVSYTENLSTLVNPMRDFLLSSVATYEDKYYKLSFTETGKTVNNLEAWYDVIEKKIDIIRDRNVACYMQTDPTIELPYKLIGRSDVNHISYADRGYNFDGVAIKYQLKTKYTAIKIGQNVRFDEFRPKIVSEGIKEVLFRYLLDDRISDLDERAIFYQALDGEVKYLGLIRIENQNAFTDSVLPQINYALGESIAFEIYGETLDLIFSMQGIGVSYIDKGLKKGKKVGQ